MDKMERISNRPVLQEILKAVFQPGEIGIQTQTEIYMKLFRDSDTPGTFL